MFTFAGKQCEDPLKLYDECVERGLPTDTFAGLANLFRVNAGAVPSAGAVLMRSDDFKLIDRTKGHTLAVTDHLGHTIPFKNLFVVEAVRVVGGALGDPDAVYLVKVADNRSRLRLVGLNKAYNLLTSDGSAYHTGTTNAGTPWTWAGMIGDVWAAVGSLGTFPGLPFTPNGTPQNFELYGAYALDSLTLVLNRVGCELQHDNTTDTYSVVRIGGGTDSTYFTSWATADEKFDGECYTPDATNRPEKVRVRFRRYPSPSDGSNPYYTVDVSLTTSTGVLAGTVVIVDDDMGALGATGTPSNSAALATRAAERGTDWERRYTKAAQSKVVQYREYLSAARKAVGERRAAAVYEDTGDGYTTEVFSHLSPLYERLQLYPPVYSGPGVGSTSSISTRNRTTGGTETQVGTTSDMRFMITTGIQIDQSPGAVAWDQVSLLAASTTQQGAVSIGTQSFAGLKTFTDDVIIDSVLTVQYPSSGAPGAELEAAAGGDITFNWVTATDASLGRSLWFSGASPGSVSLQGVTADLASHGAASNGQGFTLSAVSLPSVPIEESYLLIDAGMKDSQNVRMYIFCDRITGKAGLMGTFVGSYLWYVPHTGHAVPNPVMTDRDAEITDSNRGVILKSPNGNRWRVQVSNAGALTVTGPI